MDSRGDFHETTRGVCSFGCSLFDRIFGIKEFNKAKFNSNDNEYNDCVSMHYNSLFIALPLVTKGHKTTT